MSTSYTTLALTLGALGLSACLFNDAGTSGDAGPSGDVDLADAGSDTTLTPDVGPPDVGPPDVGPLDVGPPDVGPPDTGTPDAGDPTNLRTLQDYYPCATDVDCPVGLGSCITSVPLNRPDADGAIEVPIADLLPGLTSPGVCTETCTANDATCATLTMQGDRPDPEPWTCQLLALGQLPYPSERPAFPFDTQLDPAQQALGRAFGAICRPPFGLDARVDDSLCASCASDSDCSSDAACVDLGTATAAADGAQGVCAPACSGAADCPGGFECVDVEGSNRCLPAARSCSSCRDHDGDGFGDGRCGDSADAVTPHDCDDLDPRAHFDDDAPNHPFPTYCGAHDYNCNGLPDDDEQIGPFAYAKEHCTACGDVCEGAVQDGQRGCRIRNIDGVDAPACVAVCDTDANGDPTHADCNGLVADGCEVAIDDPSKIFFYDADGDGAGDPNNSIFDCSDSGVPPDGYVSNSDDCDDSDRLNFFGNPEVCDGRDNDCDGDADEVGTMARNASPGDIFVGGDSPSTLTVGQSCEDRRRKGICVPGVTVCYPPDGSVGCLADIRPGDQAEQCGDGLDNDCDGLTDEGAGAVGAQTYYDDADRDGFALDSAPDRSLCPNDPAVTSGAVTQTKGDCEDDNAARFPGNPEVCDGLDNDCNGSTDEAGTPGPNAWPNNVYVNGDPSDRPSTLTTGVACGDNRRRGVCVSGVTTCFPSTGRVYCLEDVSPGDQAEQCGDGIDNDCDGNTDEGGPDTLGTQIYYYDQDRDGYALDSAQPVGLCVGTPDANSGAFTQQRGDCNDDTALATPAPGTLEVCDAYDNQCNGYANEGCPTGFLGVSNSRNSGNAVGYTNLIDTNYSDAHCSFDRVVRGFRTYTQNDSINGLEIDCQDIEVYDTSGNSDYDVRYKPGTTQRLGLYGVTSGATGKTVGCPDGQVVTKLDGSYSPNRITHLQATCTDLQVTDVPGASGVTTTVSHGTGTTQLSRSGVVHTQFSLSCPAGSAMYGLNIWAAPWAFTRRISGIQMRCVDLNPGVAAGP
jgi:hypothetical protein